MLKLLTAPSLLLLTLLSACGGGGDSIDPSVPVCPAQSTGGNITISGTISFQRVHHNINSGLDYNLVSNDPARGVTVQIVNSNSRAVIASTSTNDSGIYSLQAPDNTAVFLRVRAELTNSGAASWTIRVIDNTNGGALYTLDGDHACTTINNETRDMLATHGWTGSSYNSTTRLAGPYAILDTIYQGIQLITNADPTISLPTLNINWSTRNTTTSGSLSSGQIGTSFFNSTTNAIYLLGAEDDDTDEYDQHVIAHEWGHYLEYNFSRTDSIGGYHSFGNSLDMRVAFGEGYGNAFSAMALNDPVYKDSSGIDQASGFDFDVETETLNNPGWFSEQSVEQILYDLYDSSNENTIVVTDNVTLGFAPIWNVLKNEQRTGLPLTSIFSFITALKANNVGISNDINDLVNSFSIVSNTMDEYGTTETNNSGNATSVLPVYTDLTTNGTPQNICVTDQFDRNITAFNTLGARRYFRFTIPGPGSYRFTASFASQNIGDVLDPPDPADPDIALHQSGLFAISEAVGTTEIYCRSLSAGDYILEIYDYSLFTPHSNTSTRCFNVSILPVTNC